MSVPEQEDMTVPLASRGNMEVELQTGFEIWSQTPRAARTNYDVLGNDFSQVLEIKLEPHQLVTAEPHSMLFMSPGVALDADMGGCDQGFKRCCCAGESMFRLHLKNVTAEVQKVAVTPSFPAKIVPIDLSQHSGMFFNSGAFLAALGQDWRVDIQPVCSPGVCCCAGQGLFLNALRGSGMVFLNAGGTIMTKQLVTGEQIIIDKHSLLAFERTVSIGIQRAGGCMVCCCASQGFFNTVLTGPGFVMVHSMGLSKLRSALRSGAQGNAKGE